MIELIGNLGLSAAVLAAAGTLVAAVAAARLQSQRCMLAARWLVVLNSALLTVASGALVTALVTSDFRFTYVAAYTERALPLGYKIAAFWAGQEGSLMLWGWLLSILCVCGMLSWRRLNGPEHAIAHAVLAVVCGFFALLLLFTANPFALVAGDIPTDGRGMNPQLQDIGMIIHPPLLFIGYAGFTLPFAMLVGVLAVGPHRRDNRWLSSIRRWVLISWMFLGAGIVMGAWWAYVELGWGGYWAWDPVENASLLPWLTATALLHSIIVQQHRGMFKIWNAGLIAITFLLCILGTYLTRSGVIDSVHAFAPSLIGTFFLVFLGVCVAASMTLLAWRMRALRSDRKLEGVISREGAFLVGNVLLVMMMVVTLVGTVFPLLSSAFVQQPMTVKPVFYNKVVAPMAIALVGLMAMGPALAFGVQAARKIARNLAVPALAMVLVAGIALVRVTHNPWAVVCVAIVTLGTGAVIVDFGRSCGARRRSTGESWFVCALQLVDKDHRRYGGQLSHLGIMLIVLGVAGSSVFSTESTHRVQPGDSIALERCVIRFVSLSEVRRANYTAVQAEVELVGQDGTTRTLTPQRRFYDGWADQPNSEIALRSSWREDVYVSLAGWEDGGRIAALLVKVNPLVLWIWVGGIVMVAGGCFCTLPRLLPDMRSAAATERSARQFGRQALIGPEAGAVEALSAEASS